MHLYGRTHALAEKWPYPRSRNLRVNELLAPRRQVMAHDVRYQLGQLIVYACWQLLNNASGIQSCRICAGLHIEAYHNLVRGIVQKHVPTLLHIKIISYARKWGRRPFQNHFADGGQHSLSLCFTRVIQQFRRCLDLRRGRAISPGGKSKQEQVVYCRLRWSDCVRSGVRPSSHVR